MAICQYCVRDMASADTCDEYVLIYEDGVERDPVPFGEEERFSDDQTPDGENPTCFDCGIEHGGIHHPGCDWAECPRCRGQLLMHERAIAENFGAGVRCNILTGIAMDGDVLDTPH